MQIEGGVRLLGGAVSVWQWRQRQSHEGARIESTSRGARTAGHSRARVDVDWSTRNIKPLSTPNGTTATALWAVTLAPFVYIRVYSLDATSPSCVLTEVWMRTGWRIAKLYKWSLKIHWQLVRSDAIRDVRLWQVPQLLEELVWSRWASSSH